MTPDEARLFVGEDVEMTWDDYSPRKWARRVPGWLWKALPSGWLWRTNHHRQTGFVTGVFYDQNLADFIDCPDCVDEWWTVWMNGQRSDQPHLDSTTAMTVLT